MPLWGNSDNASGNTKPKYANTANALYGGVYGVSATEMSSVEKAPQHAGWVSAKYGSGPIKGIAVVGGTGYNAAGYLTVTDNSAMGTGSGANISFTIANSRNTLQSYSSNAHWNVISSIVVNNGGSGYSDSSNIELAADANGITPAAYQITLGGRGDRVTYETLVAMGSITGDSASDNTKFSGI